MDSPITPDPELKLLFQEPPEPLFNLTPSQKHWLIAGGLFCASFIFIAFSGSLGYMLLTRALPGGGWTTNVEDAKAAAKTLRSLGYVLFVAGTVERVLLYHREFVMSNASNLHDSSSSPSAEAVKN